MLIVALDASRKEPLYEQIYNSIKEEIVTGALPFGARLPSARRLAKHLDVSRNTVDTAYAQLCAEGYIESKPKRGFFVCQVEELAELHIPVKIEDEEEEIKKEEVPYDFSPVGVDMTQFPYHIWRKLLKEIMINDNSELFQKGNFQGDLVSVYALLPPSAKEHYNTLLPDSISSQNRDFLFSQQWYNGNPSLKTVFFQKDTHSPLHKNRPYNAYWPVR